MEMRRNYTVVLPSLQHQQLKSIGQQRENCIHLIIKHYEDGVLTPTLNKLSIGINFVIKINYIYLTPYSPDLYLMI